MRKVIYADHSATTYVKDEVLKEMLPYFSHDFGNPSSMYSIGRDAKRAIDKARCQVASAIGSRVDEIYFTSCGSEADNMILLAIARASKDKGRHIITTKIEHLAILNTCKVLEKEGFDISYLNVDKDGVIDLNELKNTIRLDTILISVMFANNEIGTIQPIDEIGKIAKNNNIYFHTDAVQVIGNIHIDVQKSNIDALSLAAHKFYGPKGVGVAYIKRGINMVALINGGHQEKNIRAGTENVAGIVGLGHAITLANQNIDEYNKKLAMLSKLFLTRIKDEIPDIKLNGHPIDRLPGNVNISIKGVDSQSLLLLLDMYNICASVGSACNTCNISPSHVLTAIGLNADEANSTVRFTFGQKNTVSDVIYISNALIEIVSRLRISNN